VKYSNVEGFSESFLLSFVSKEAATFCNQFRVWMKPLMLATHVPISARPVTQCITILGLDELHKRRNKRRDKRHSFARGSAAIIAFNEFSLYRFRIQHDALPLQ
jgi:hypothetical protein